MEFSPALVSFLQTLWCTFGDEPQEWANITGIDFFVPTIVRIQEHEIGDLIRHVFQNTVIFYATIHVFTKAYLQFTAAKAKEQNNEIRHLALQMRSIGTFATHVL